MKHNKRRLVFISPFRTAGIVQARAKFSLREMLGTLPDSLEDPLQLPRACLDRKFLARDLPPALSETARLFRIRDEPLQRSRESLGIALRHEFSVYPGLDHLGDPSQRRRDYRQSGSHRFHYDGRQIIHAPVRLASARQSKN